MAKNDDKPLPAKEQRFIHFFTQSRDLEKAAGLAGFKPSFGARLYKRPEIREEIDRRIGIVEVEQAKLIAKDIVLTMPVLDKNLMEIIELPAKEFALAKLRALQFGYVLQGKVRIGNTEAIVERAPGEGQNNFYRAFESTTTTVREVTAGPPAAQAQTPVRKPKTIEAELPPPKEEQPQGSVWKY
jgi:hypothetical protein